MTPTQTLTPAESSRLAELEPKIERGLKNFVEVGTALVEIADLRLYRGTHSTFDEYCKDKWKMTAHRAYRLSNSAEVMNKLSVTHGSQIKNERQARELGKVAPEKRAKVIESAAASAEAESRPMTARDIETAAKAQSGPSLEAKVEAAKETFAASGITPEAIAAAEGPKNGAKWIAIIVEEECNIARERILGRLEPGDAQAVNRCINAWAKSLQG